ncbi:hypothetical protein SPSIL_009700 [Sporomusa silvacetica DSM 10669]|uniref:Uncharacterized protein n=1 Tax=Sporomusa silvacetica DSM 10669 TaxID=1123289 RepID=A0ABZ3IGR6_9FIRM|nr:hypothetical protein SPSIL_55260 [Sporomusa silvacetica DSM 10669]
MASARELAKRDAWERIIYEQSIAMLSRCGNLYYRFVHNYEFNIYIEQVRIA